MDPIHKRVLAIKIATIMSSVTNPSMLASHLSTLFCSSDKEEIDATQRNHGATYATQKLLSLLEKRGPKAFNMFITALNHPNIFLPDLAEELQDEERKLRGGQGARLTESPVPPYPMPESPVTPSTRKNFDDQLDGEKDDYPLPLSAASTVQLTHEESNSKLNNLSQGQEQASPSKPSSTADAKNDVLSLVSHKEGTYNVEVCCNFLQFSFHGSTLGMDPIHKKVLAIKTATIMNSIPNPSMIASHLSTLFCSSDKEEIDAMQKNNGPTQGAQKLLSLLEKRGPKAFNMFITALKDPNIVLGHLANELQEEERKLRGGQGALTLPRPASPVPPFPTPESPIPPSPRENFDDPLDGQKDDYPLPPSAASTIQFTHEESDSKLNNLSQGQGQASASKHSSIADGKYDVLSLETLIKDIPYSLRLKIEKLMDPSDANHHDWRGVASVMHLSADDVRQLENTQENGKMKGLIEKMIQLKKTINDLLGWLRDPNVARWDVIDEMKRCPNNIPSNLLSPETESSEDQSVDVIAMVTSPVEETFHSESKSESKAVPIQEPSKKPDEKLEARTPKQEEYDIDQQKLDSKTSANPVQEQSQECNEKPDGRIPKQETKSEDNENEDHGKTNLSTPTQEEGKDGNDFDDKPDHQTPTQEEQPNSISSVEDDDEVFENSDDGKKEFHPLLISCCGSEEQDQKHEKELKKLREILENCWENADVQFCKRVKESEFGKRIHSFIKPKESVARRSVYFAYLVGPTVQINGENYLLPRDLKTPSSRADLIHSSLNINWLVKQLSKKYMQVVIVDGAYDNHVVTDCVKLKGVLPGLAPIQPPPNAIIAFPCRPGSIRKEGEERLAFISSLVEILDRESNVMLADVFDRVRAELKSKNFSPSMEFSLISSPLPISINSEANQEIQVCSSAEMKCHAVLVSNWDGSNAFDASANRCLKKAREELRIALLKSGWECEDICDKSAEFVKESLRKTLTKLADGVKKVVMLYFMGHTKMIMDCNYFYGGDLEAFLEDPNRSGVPLQWVLDLMCEKTRGPKLLVVDDVGSNASNLEELAEMSAPFDVMISLPRNTRQRARSFTSNFARLLGDNSMKLSLKDKLEKAALNDPHRLNSNLLDPR
ncbi:uncharacterized protein LOC111331953 [Stylophora pistillata]|uniref:uncharacterized protein LOC111331953 n=1 Tax=Stylophora pistillata TaxID=50429 RepID=UPI000C056E98|nr:uncharacterized protein LOC111331953 [Stylophora pistillata]